MRFVQGQDVFFLSLNILVIFPSDDYHDGDDGDGDGGGDSDNDGDGGDNGDDGRRCKCSLLWYIWLSQNISRFVTFTIAMVMIMMLAQ